MYSIKEITDAQAWDTYIEREKPSTFMQSSAWGDAEAATGKKVFRFGVFVDVGNVVTKQQVAALQVVALRARRGNLLLCPHGPVISRGESAQKTAEILSEIKKHLAALGKKEKCDAVRLSPILLDTEENKKAFRVLGFKRAPIHVYPEISWILDIRPSEEELLNGMKKNTRYGVRKAEKDGVTITSSASMADFEMFWDIYMDTARRQSFVPHPRKLVEAEFKNFAEKDQVRLYFAYHAGEVISTAMIIYCGDSAFYHHGASRPHSKITPGELLQWQVIRDAKARGLTRYNFWGVVPEGKKNHAWAHLDKFKKGFGGYAENYVPTQDYPLTPKYVITYVIETIRRLKRRV